jgi:predicted O-methyltransferase YrrM
MKWILQNARRRGWFAIQNPGYVLKALINELTLADERFLAGLTSVSPWQIRDFLDEPINTPAFAAHLRSAQNQFQTLSVESADLYAKKVLNQYAAVRALAPQCIVETGLANGVSSSYLLLALQKNGHGSLHSVGLANPAFLPAGKQPGWLVPEWLRTPWHVHIGDARDLLPGLFGKLGRVDVFIHDSLHSYDHMMWEFDACYPYLRIGGLLFADDALWNESFPDFARKVMAPQARILRGVGFLKKK